MRERHREHEQDNSVKCIEDNHQNPTDMNSMKMKIEETENKNDNEQTEREREDMMMERKKCQINIDMLSSHHHSIKHTHKTNQIYRMNEYMWTIEAPTNPFSFIGEKKVWCV